MTNVNRSSAAADEPQILYHIDSPATRRVSSDGWISFGGWALSLDGLPVTVRLKVSGGAGFQVALEIPRPDVLAAFRDRLASEQLNCGFAFSMNMQEYKGGAQVHFEFEDRDHLTCSPPYTLEFTGLARVQYQEVWDSLTGAEEDAKRMVAGLTDEARFDEEAQTTKRVLLECVRIGRQDVVLEIGAGVGRVGKVLAPLCKEWIGADVSANMLGHLKRRLQGLPNVRTVLLNGYDLGPVSSESVDVVYCTVVLMHLDEWDRFRYVQEGWRVLRPGGRMFADNFNLLSEEGWAVFESIAANFPPLQRPPHIGKSSTPQELQAYFERAGFIDVRQKTDGQWIRTFGVKTS